MITESLLMEIPIIALLTFLLFRLENLNARIGKIEKLLNIPVNLLVEEVKNGVVTKGFSKEIEGLNSLKRDNHILSIKKQEEQSL